MASLPNSKKRNHVAMAKGSIEAQPEIRKALKKDVGDVEDTITLSLDMLIQEVSTHANNLEIELLGLSSALAPVMVEPAGATSVGIGGFSQRDVVSRSPLGKPLADQCYLLQVMVSRVREMRAYLDLDPKTP